MNHPDPSRREFLRRASAVSAMGVAAPWAMNLAAIGEAAAQTATDYKALVCVFLYGGNDHGNTLIPYDSTTHATYTTLRGALALPRESLAATELVGDLALPEGRIYAVAPQLAPLKTLFDEGVMAPMLNIGPLVQPMTKAEYTSGAVLLPPKLFSHNDQQSVWQASNPEGAVNGWGGRIGDVFASGNGQSVFTAVSVAGNAVFLSGQSVRQYQVSSAGSIAINGISSTLFGSAAAAQAMRSLVAQPGDHVMLRSYADLVTRSIDADVALRAAVANVPAFATAFPATPLGGQMAMAAKMIAARSALGAKRQVFLVSLGGFDSHDDLLADHPGLLSSVADAMTAFYRATVELGVADKVTSFTASDFGRTLSSNGDGSDHGWGAYHFAVGGAVRGRRFYGAAPVLGNGGPDDVGQGRMLPTMAVDQLAATLASWMGVSDAGMADVVPGITRYSTRNLGFMV